MENEEIQKLHEIFMLALEGKDIQGYRTSYDTVLIKLYADLHGLIENQKERRYAYSKIYESEKDKKLIQQRFRVKEDGEIIPTVEFYFWYHRYGYLYGNSFEFCLDDFRSNHPNIQNKLAECCMFMFGTKNYDVE